VPRDRKRILTEIEKNPEISVLILGAGINGIGTFRDLALQGVDVLIVDRGDFCSGASSASSHMVHGGIRYLENGEFRLVREAVQERNRLIMNAPHQVHPLPTTFPIFKWFSGIFNAPLKFLGLMDKPAERGALLIKMGLILYDAFASAQGTVPKHQFLTRQKSLHLYPHLNPNILFTATYYDAAMPSPERICMDLIHDATQASEKAMALNYMPLVGVAKGTTLTLQDRVGGKTYQVRPKLVVNAAGPWIDIVNHVLGQETDFIGGTKGSHLVLDHPELRRALQDHEFFFENKDGRIVLLFPLMDKVLVGTSDIRITDPDQARCTEEEIDYFFAMISRVFPKIKVDRSHIAFRFSGVRPLPASKGGFTGQISRDHSIKTIHLGDLPVHCLIGGKWTTFRAFSEQAADRVLEDLGRTRQVSTKKLPVGGGKGFPTDKDEQRLWLAALKDGTDLPAARLAVLLGRYGTRAHEIARRLAKGPDRPLKQKSDYSSGEIRYLVQREKVIHLEDLLLRRTLLAKLGQLTPKLIEELAEIAGDALGWSQKTREDEARRAMEILES
jgi:glycerol-3-phosphate dehydrogenase